MPKIFTDADGNQVELPDDFTPERYNDLAKKDFDYEGLKAKKEKEQKEFAEKAAADAAAKAKAEAENSVEGKLSKLEQERVNDLMDTAMSFYVDTDNAEETKKFKEYMSRDLLSAEEKQLPTKDQIRLKAKYANQLLGGTNNALANNAFSNTGRTVRQDSNQTRFTDTEDGKKALGSLRPRRINQPKK